MAAGGPGEVENVGEKSKRWGKVGKCKENLGKNGGKRLETLGKCEEHVEKNGEGKGWEKVGKRLGMLGTPGGKYLGKTCGICEGHLGKRLGTYDEHRGTT